jgi:transposase
LINDRFDLIIGVEMSLKKVQECLNIDRRLDKREKSNIEMYAKTYKTEWPFKVSKTDSPSSKKTKMYMHIYYNDQHLADDRLKFNKKLDNMEDYMSNHKLNSELEEACLKNYQITRTGEKISHAPRHDIIDLEYKNAGFFVLLSSSEKSAEETLKIYRSKDMIEKAFSDLKNRLNMRRTYVPSEENLEEKFFIQYGALVS